MQVIIRILMRIVLVFFFVAVVVFFIETLLHSLSLFSVQFPVTTEAWVVSVRFCALPIGVILGLLLADKFVFKIKDSVFLPLFVASIVSIIGTAAGIFLASRVQSEVAILFLFVILLLSLTSYHVVPRPKTKQGR